MQKQHDKVAQSKREVQCLKVKNNLECISDTSKNASENSDQILKPRSSNPATFWLQSKTNQPKSVPLVTTLSRTCTRSMQPDSSAIEMTPNRLHRNASQPAQPTSAHPFHPTRYQSPETVALAAQSLVGIMGGVERPTSAPRTHHGTEPAVSLQPSQINIRRGDSVDAKKQNLQLMQRWGYLKDYFLAEDQSARNKFIQQLCGVPALPADLSAELAAVLNKVLARALPPTPTAPLLKTCRCCKKKITTTKRRFVHCGTKYAINMLMCKDCRIGIGAYNDLAQLQPPGDILSAWNPIDAHTDKLRKIKLEPRSLEARGRTWARFIEPSCQGLYLSRNRNDKLRALTKHRETIAKLISTK